jgi:isochorismate synthase
MPYLLELENYIISLFHRILEISEVKSTTNFFENGGNSLKAILLTNHLNQNRKIKVLPSFIFLHPTPAVCGLPKENAKQFILENEGYERKFYSGFLGELNLNTILNKVVDSDLFVNLRCMEIERHKVHLYIGCGITKDSNPEKEYIETANKAMTMKQILK